MLKLSLRKNSSSSSPVARTHASARFSPRTGTQGNLKKYYPNTCWRRLPVLPPHKHCQISHFACFYLQWLKELRECEVSGHSWERDLTFLPILTPGWSWNSILQQAEETNSTDPRHPMSLLSRLWTCFMEEDARYYSSSTYHIILA